MSKTIYELITVPSTEQRPQGNHSFCNESKQQEFRTYFSIIRSYVRYIIDNLGNIKMTDKIGNYRYCYGLDLEYKGKSFSLIWENPEWYDGHFAEILGPNYITKRFDLKDVGNVKKYLKKIIKISERSDQSDKN
jgi:hypothetical protein